MRKFTSIILISLTLLSTLAACGETGNQSENTTIVDLSSAPESNEEIPVAYDMLPEANYDGYTFTMLTSEGWSVDMKDQLIIETETGDVLFDSIFARNRAVEEKFNINIAVKTITYGDVAAAVRTDVQSGDGAYDIIVHSPVPLSQLVAEKLFVDVDTLEYLHLNEKWYSQTANSEMNIAGKQYLFHTDIGFVWTSTIIVMLLNRDMAYNEFGIEDLQKLAVEGGWTINKLIEVSKGVTSDLDGNGVLNEYDRHGLAIDLGEYITAFQYGSNIRATEKDSTGQPKLSLNSPKMTDVLNKIYNYVYDETSVFITTGNVDGANYRTPLEMFRDGHNLFCNLNITLIPKIMRDMEDDYGVLPMPKYDEMQDKYYTAVSPGSTTVFAIPTSNNDLERTSIITDALAYEGHTRVIPTYVEQAIKVKYSRDEYSDVIYDMILDGAILDFGTIFDPNKISVIFQGLLRDGSTDFTSKYDSLESAATAEYDRIWALFVD